MMGRSASRSALAKPAMMTSALSWRISRRASDWNWRLSDCGSGAMRSIFLPRTPWSPDFSRYSSASSHTTASLDGASPRSMTEEPLPSLGCSVGGFAATFANTPGLPGPCNPPLSVNPSLISLIASWVPCHLLRPKIAKFPERSSSSPNLIVDASAPKTMLGTPNVALPRPSAAPATAPAVTNSRLVRAGDSSLPGPPSAGVSRSLTILWAGSRIALMYSSPPFVLNASDRTGPRRISSR